VIGLHAVYGYIKLGRWSAAAGWLWRALRSDPSALFQRRWFDLALAGLQRRRGR